MFTKLYCIAQKFHGSKFLRIAVFENFVEIISLIHCPKHTTPTLFMGITCWNSISRALELSFIDLAAVVNTRNLEGMPTFDVLAMVRGYLVYQHVWDASIHEELPCAREADNLQDPFAVAVMKSHQTVEHIPMQISLLKYWNIAILPSTIENHWKLLCTCQKLHWNNFANDAKFATREIFALYSIFSQRWWVGSRLRYTTWGVKVIKYKQYNKTA